MSDSLDRLYAAVLAARVADPASSRTARLLRAGRGKMAKKLAEEAIEVAIDAVHGVDRHFNRFLGQLLRHLAAARAQQPGRPRARRVGDPGSQDGGVKAVERITHGGTE